MSSARTGGSGSATSSPNRLIGFILGGIYLLVGLLGFTVTGDVGFADQEGDTLLGFELNNLHNIVHLLVAAILLAGAAKGVASAKGANTAVGAVYLLVGIIGLFILDSDANILALNSADNVLHLGSAAVLLAVALTQDKAVSSDGTRTVRR
jgi:hypothetical protein